MIGREVSSRHDAPECGGVERKIGRGYAAERVYRKGNCYCGKEQTYGVSAF